MGRHLEFTGRGKTLFFISAKNLLLALLTLGVYQFWGKTRVRRYLMSNLGLQGSSFEYRGTGEELLFGYLKAVTFVLFPLALLFSIAAIIGGDTEVVLSFFLTILLVYLMFVGRYAALRYLLTRTRWRGIRFFLHGSPWRHGAKVILQGALFTLTVGLSYPFFRNTRLSLLFNNAALGSGRFRYTGRGRDLLAPFVLMILLLPFTLGISWVWYRCREYRYVTRHLSFETIAFDTEIRTASLLWYYVTNLGLLVMTLGIAYPWTVTRRLRLFERHLMILGELDGESLVQLDISHPATGEGISEMMGSGWV